MSPSFRPAMQTPIHSPDESATALGAFFCLLWLIILIGWLVGKSHAIAETVAWFRRKAAPARIVIAFAFLVVLTYGSVKSGGNAPQGLPRPPLLLQVEEPPQEPAIAPVSVHTNGVALRPESTNAVEVTAFRTVGGTELGDWIEIYVPFFAVGTNPVSRCYVSASGSVSFETMRRPQIGRPLPDESADWRRGAACRSADGSSANVTDAGGAARAPAQTRLYPVLCPLRAPLGMVPEARWAQVFGQNAPGARFWHDALPGGGRVLTWENALVDRLPGRRVSLQVEMRPSGDSVFRYSFQDELHPPATNFVMGAQMGTNGVNALSILGTNTLAATVWNVDGAPVTNGVSIADLLCTNGVLRTPVTFEIRWKNTTGLVPNADTDSDGLTDWAETFLWGTDPNRADTDGDGFADNIEVLMGQDPFDADVNGDGVPDGTSAADWAANTLWAENATNGAHAITITLNSEVPVGTSASLMVGNLCIPLRSPGSWTLGLVPGELYPYRLVVGGNTPVDLSIGPGNETPQGNTPLRGPRRSAAASGLPPFWRKGSGAVFDGPSGGGIGNMAFLLLSLDWVDPGNGSHLSEIRTDEVCLHGIDEAVFSPSLQPAVPVSFALENLTEREGNLVLGVPHPGQTFAGTASLAPGMLEFGTLTAVVFAHECDSGYETPYCSICGHYQPDDLTLSVRSPLTLKHDNQTTISIVHAYAPDETHADGLIEIRRNGSTNTWETLGTESSLDPWTARIAGTFELRGTTVIDGQSYTTPSVEVEVRFPCFAEITNDTAVVNMTTAAWADTLADCSPTNRRERGFWIYLNTRQDTYEAGPLCLGEWSGIDDGAAVQLPRRPVDETEPIGPLDMGARYPVASFHCHTSPHYWTWGVRDVGPSRDDRRLDSTDQVPGLVYDYIEDSPGSGEVGFGHPINAAAQLYKSLGLERRPTP